MVKYTIQWRLNNDNSLFRLGVPSKFKYNFHSTGSLIIKNWFWVLKWRRTSAGTFDKIFGIFLLQICNDEWRIWNDCVNARLRRLLLLLLLLLLNSIGSFRFSKVDHRGICRRSDTKCRHDIWHNDDQFLICLFDRVDIRRHFCRFDVSRILVNSVVVTF